MGGTIIPTGFAQLAYHFQGPLLGHDAVVTLGVAIPTGWTPVASEMTALVAALMGVGKPGASMSTVWRCSQLKVYVGGVGGSAVFEQAASTTGGVSGACSPPLVTWLVKKNTAMAGRKGRGRMFLPGVPEAATGDDGTIAAGTVTTMSTALEAWRTALPAIGPAPGLAAVLLHSVVGVAPTPIVSLALSPEVGLQRRRSGK